VAAILRGHEIAVIDTETTGFSPAFGHVLVEVAVVRLLDGTPGETWSALVDSGRPIPPDATAVHGITDGMVKQEGIPPAVAAQRLREACAERPLAFHNAPFDLPFLVALLREQREPPLSGPVIDTLGLARGLFGAGGNSLGALAQRLRLPAGETHRALADALTTARLLVELAGLWERDRGVRSLEELAAASQDVVRATARPSGVGVR
jgi:DNA polymerase-3 subunit epsilon